MKKKKDKKDNNVEYVDFFKGHRSALFNEQVSFEPYEGPTELELALWEITDELADVLLSKHNDYGPKNISEAPGGALNGLRVRIHDKTARINNLIDSSITPNYESLEDSFLDLANYAIISLLVLREKWGK